jgi:peptidyl-prolyl cis-trans isomerase D
MLMRKLREKMKVIMLVTAAAFVLLMVVEDFDFGAVMGAEMAGGELGRVNGEAITHEEFSRAYQELYQRRQQESQEPISTTENRELEDAAWEQVVMERLLQQEIERRGLAATTAEIRQAARTSPPPDFVENEMFHTDGQFDMAKWHQFLASPALDSRLLLELEQYYRSMIPRAKLFGQITAGIHVSDSELWRQWRDRHEQVQVRYVTINPATAVPDAAVSVTDREIRDFYNRHRDDFLRPASASVRMITLSKAPAASDTADARDRALELRREIRGGADFAELARQESADRGSAEAGGELGTFQRGQMVPAFEQAVWSQPLGEAGEPVLTQFGFHLIQVQSRDAEQATARHILIPIELSIESEDALLARADEAEALARTRTLTEIGEELGLAVRQVELNETMPFAPGVGRIEDGALWIFEDGAEPAEISPLFDTADAYYMLELIEHRPSRRLTLEEATPTIRTSLLEQKKRERARVLGRELLDRIRAGQTLEEAARAQDLPVQQAGPFSRMDFVPGLGQANAAIGAAFGLQEPGAVSGLVEAGRRLYIIELIDRTQADREAWEEQKEMQRAITVANMEQYRINQFIDGLREDARITDRRAEVLRRRL